MSDDNDDKEVGKGKNGKRSVNPDKDLTEPVVKDQELFEWLEKLFYDTPEPAHYPQRLELCSVSGRSLERLGHTLEQKQYAPSNASDTAQKAGAGSRKPTREELVGLANMFLFRMQQDCDVKGRETAYGLHAWHYSRGDQPYSRFLRRCKPSGKYRNYAGANGTAQNDDDDEESAEKKFSTQILKHQEAMVGLLGGGFEGMLDRHDKTEERLLRRIEQLEEKNSKLLEQLERALNCEIEREERRTMLKAKSKFMEEGVNMVLGLAPPLLNQLVSKTAPPANTPTPETITIKNFIESLTPEQQNGVFGEFGEDLNTLIKPGVLTREQGELLVHIARCEVPVDRINDLMPGGPFGITQEQAMALGGVVEITKLAPLYLIFQAREKRQAAQQQQ